jgi:hypothetical protein
MFGLMRKKTALEAFEDYRNKIDSLSVSYVKKAWWIGFQTGFLIFAILYFLFWSSHENF